MKNFLKKIHSIFQKSTTSFVQHNQQYEDSNAFERAREICERNIKNNEINNASFRVLDLLEKHQSVKTTVDIGSGVGWISASLSNKMEKIIAIEPSAAAIEIAKKLFPSHEYPNIIWKVGLGEDLLPILHLDKPTLFVTGCVLSHLRDSEAAKICQLVSNIAPTGSILSFDERWGETRKDQFMWHVRTQEWWRENLAGWELDFHGAEVDNRGYNAGIHGVKK